MPTPDPIFELRTLLKRYTEFEGSTEWSYGAVSGTIETAYDTRDGSYGRTCFLPLDDEKIAAALQAEVGAMWSMKYCEEIANRIISKCRGSDLEILEAEITAKAVDALSKLLAIAEAALELRDSGYDGPFMGDAVAPLFAALAAVDAARKAQ